MREKIIRDSQGGNNEEDGNDPLSNALYKNLVDQNDFEKRDPIIMVQK